MIVYQINLPKTKNAEDFVRFMKEDYIPSVHKEATRVGKVTGLTLLQNKDAASHSFLWQVGWSGLHDREPHIDDESVARKFAAFGAKFKRLGEFTDVASWSEEA